MRRRKHQGWLKGWRTVYSKLEIHLSSGFLELLRVRPTAKCWALRGTPQTFTPHSSKRLKANLSEVPLTSQPPLFQSFRSLSSNISLKHLPNLKRRQLVTKSRLRPSISRTNFKAKKDSAPSQVRKRLYWCKSNQSDLLWIRTLSNLKTRKYQQSYTRT